MNLEPICRESIDIIKSKWGLPKSGFIAGGSIANIVWEIVSGNKAVVNDVDIFIFDGYQEKIDHDNKSNLFNYKDITTKFGEDYTGICLTTYTKNFYSITESTSDGIFNYIKYKSNIYDPSLIINSFDINSTSVGYSIDEDKFYWTKDFEDFINTGNLKVINLTTPSHTACRLAKKSKELNVRLDQFEFDLIKFSFNCSFVDKIKLRFKDRYRKMYYDNIDLLGDHFNINRSYELEEYLENRYGVITELFFLNNKDNKIEETEFGPVESNKLFIDNNLNRIYKSTDFIFYMRNIYYNEELKAIWNDLYYFFEDGYVDRFPEKEDIELISRFSKYAPNSIQHLKGLKMSKQIEIIKKFLDRFKDDPIIAISILENYRVDEMVLDDDTSLILELCVRKHIINDTNNKVGKILGYDEINTNEINTLNIF